MSLFPYYLSYIIIVAVALYSFSRRKSYLALLSGVIAVVQGMWIHLFIYEMSSFKIKDKIFYDDLQFSALTIYVFLVLLFVILFTHRLNRWNVILLSTAGVFFIISNIFKSLTFFEGYFREDVKVSFVRNYLELTYEFGVLYKFILIFFFVVSIYIFLLLTIEIIKSDKYKRVNSILFFSAFFLLTITGVFTIFKIRIYLFVNSMPLAMGFSSFLLALAALRYKALDNMPDFIDDILDNLTDPVIITDSNYVVIECNLMSRNIFKVKNGDSLMDNDFLKKYTCNRELGAPDEISFNLAGEEYFFKFNLSTIQRNKRSSSGVVYTFHNITDIKRGQFALRSMKNNLEEMVNDRVKELKKEIAQRINAESDLKMLNEELRVTQKEIMLSLSEVVESKSRETANHVVRVAGYSYLLAKCYGLSDIHSELIRDAAPLHDVGKIGISDEILNKAGLLDSEEREIMKKHTQIGYDIFGKSQRELLKEAAIIALEHHERWDGKGYPMGKSGTGISLSGRIVGLSDVFDALLSSRVYKPGWDINQVIEYIKRESGRQFDPDLVRILIENISEFKKISDEFVDI